MIRLGEIHNVAATDAGRRVAAKAAVADYQRARHGRNAALGTKILWF